jgi:hypothetical protein
MEGNVWCDWDVECDVGIIPIQGNPVNEPRKERTEQVSAIDNFFGFSDFLFRTLAF